MALRYTPGVQLEPYQVVLRPLVTEKGAYLAGKNQYTFQVHQFATKPEIKQAVEQLWGVKVDKVRTQMRVGKPRRHKMVMSHMPSWKRAIVTLNEDDRIAFF